MKFRPFNKMHLEFAILGEIFLQLLLYISPISGEWPNDLNTQFPFPNPSPIDINSSRAMVIPGLPPINITLLSSKNTLNVTNNGRTIFTTIIQPVTRAILTGSIFKNEIYEFHEVSLYLSNNYKASCGTLIDGQGTPIEFAHSYAKKEYSSIENAKTHRDGIVTIIERVIVDGVIPNKRFSFFASYLKQLKNPGSSVVGSVPQFFEWYDRLPNVTSYYMHPGTYFDPYTGFGYESAVIIILSPTQFASITVDQFRLFQELLANDGLPISNSLPSFQMNETPLIQATGINLK